MEDNIEKIKSDFKSWPGFDLIGENIDEMRSHVMSILWDLECELNQQAKQFTKRIDDLPQPPKK